MSNDADLATADTNLAHGKPPCWGLGDLFNSPYREDHYRARVLCDMCPSAQKTECNRILEQTIADYTAAAVEGTWAGRLINGSERGRAPGSRKRAAA